MAQGGWNIQYFPITKIPSDIIGKEVRIDFKGMTDQQESLPTDIDIRALTSKQDSIYIRVDNEFILCTESWKIYPDQGFLNEQSLKIINSKNFPNSYIKEMYITKVDEAKIYLDIVIHINNEVTKSSMIIDKAIVQGILMKL